MLLFSNFIHICSVCQVCDDDDYHVDDDQYKSDDSGVEGLVTIHEDEEGHGNSESIT